MRRAPWILVALIAAIVLPPLIGRSALLSDTNALLLCRGCVMALAGLSLNLLMGYAGQVSLGQFAFVGVGAFTLAHVTGVTDLRLPWVVGMLASAALGAVVAFLVGLPALRLRGLYLAIVTIGVVYACSESLFIAQGIGGGSAGKVVPPPYVAADAISRNCDLLAVGLVLLVVMWHLDTNLTRSRLGRAFHAVKADERVAASFGIDVASYKLLAFVLSGAVAGLAGGFFGTTIGTVQAASFTYADSLGLVVIVVVGGLGSRPGVVGVAFGTTVLPSLLVTLFGSGIRGYDLIFNAAVLVYTITRNPTGIAGAIREARTKALERRGGEPPLPPTRPNLPSLGRPSALPAPRRAAAGQPVLAVRDIGVRFGGLRAVDGASITVDRGTIVGLMGPNGAGKTTLFNAITGALRPDSGTVTFLGEDVSHLPTHLRAARGMGRTFQLIGLAKDQSVYENLLIAQHLAAPYSVGSALSGLGASRALEREIRSRADQTIEGLGFERFASTPVGKLSHGQQRIVEIGCCLVTSPELVMLDEPSAGMSPAASEDLALTLQDVRDKLGRTVLLIEHNVPLVLGVADELYVMAAGEVIANGEPLDVVTRPEVVTAYLGSSYEEALK
ncbi:MAG: ABC-type branched-chain amino acid transport system, ATPase component [Frankiales bacterium]|nr:ABC-type branched-chain amino acid transport system, ATPase component [Frankiales bacterium]